MSYISFWYVFLSLLLPGTVPLSTFTPMPIKITSIAQPSIQPRIPLLKKKHNYAFPSHYCVFLLFAPVPSCVCAAASFRPTRTSSFAGSSTKPGTAADTISTFPRFPSSSLAPGTTVSPCDESIPAMTGSSCRCGVSRFMGPDVFCVV